MSVSVDTLEDHYDARSKEEKRLNRKGYLDNYRSSATPIFAESCPHDRENTVWGCLKGLDSMSSHSIINYG